MGGDWYNIITYYGLVIDIPGGENYRKFVSKAYRLQAFIEEGFEIISLLPRFHSRMEYDQGEELDSLGVLFIGFKVSNNLDELAKRAAELEIYVKDNIVFEGYDVISGGQFFSGIKWDEDQWGMIEDDEDDEDDGDDEDDEDDESNEGDTGSETSSSELEHNEECSDVDEKPTCIAAGGAGAK